MQALDRDDQGVESRGLHVSTVVRLILKRRHLSPDLLCSDLIWPFESGKWRNSVLILQVGATAHVWF